MYVSTVYYHIWETIPFCDLWQSLQNPSSFGQGIFTASSKKLRKWHWKYFDGVDFTELQFGKGAD